MNFLAELLAKMFRELLGWGQAQAEKPAETKNANTPKDVRDELNGAVADFVRHQDQHRD